MDTGDHEVDRQSQANIEEYKILVQALSNRQVRCEIVTILFSATFPHCRFTALGLSM